MALTTNVNYFLLVWTHVSRFGVNWPILRDPRAVSRGERQIKRAKEVRAKVYKTGGNSPWEDTCNGLVQERIWVLASDWPQILWHCIFVPNQRSAYFAVPFVTSYTECNFAKFCYLVVTRAYWNQADRWLGTKIQCHKKWSIRIKNANGLLNLSVKGFFPGKIYLTLNFRSHQASARIYFARFICL